MPTALATISIFEAGLF